MHVKITQNKYSVIHKTSIPLASLNSHLYFVIIDTNTAPPLKVTAQPLTINSFKAKSHAKVHAFIPSCKTNHIDVIGEPVDCRLEEVQLNRNQFAFHGAAVTSHVECFLCIHKYFSYPGSFPYNMHTNESHLRVYRVYVLECTQATNQIYVSCDRGAIGAY